MHEYAKWKDPLQNRRQSAYANLRDWMTTIQTHIYLKASCNGMQIPIRSNFVIYLQWMAALLPNARFPLMTRLTWSSWLLKFSKLPDSARFFAWLGFYTICFWPLPYPSRPFTRSYTTTSQFQTDFSPERFSIILTNTQPLLDHYPISWTNSISTRAQPDHNTTSSIQSYKGCVLIIVLNF